MYDEYATTELQALNKLTDPFILIIFQNVVSQFFPNLPNTYTYIWLYYKTKLIYTYIAIILQFKKYKNTNNRNLPGPRKAPCSLAALSRPIPVNKNLYTSVKNYYKVKHLQSICGRV